VLWLVQGTHRGDKERFSVATYARDILRGQCYRWIERIAWTTLVLYCVHVAVIAAVATAAACCLYGYTAEALRMTLSVLVWGVAVRTVMLWHNNSSVNSITHVSGYLNFDTPDISRNNWFVALLMAGEGWHNIRLADSTAATVCAGGSAT